jgi:hypothetical protein
MRQIDHVDTEAHRVAKMLNAYLSLATHKSNKNRYIANQINTNNNN